MSEESQRLRQRLHNLLVNVARDGGRAERAIRGDNAVQLAVATLLDEFCSIGCCGSDQVGEAAQGLPCLVCTAECSVSEWRQSRQIGRGRTYWSI